MGRLGGSVVQYNSKNEVKPGYWEEKCQYSNSTEMYTCKTGHCCENDTCCRKYFEEWWFWFIWAVVIILTCCCVYHHRRNRQNGTTQNNRQEGAYAGVCNYPGPPVDKEMLGYCKLPKYQEVIRIPPSGSPPPPYTERRVFRSIARLQPGGGTGLEIMHQSDLTSSVMSLVASAFNLNFRGSTTFTSSPESNQDIMDSITEVNNSFRHTDQSNGFLLPPPNSNAAGQYLDSAKEPEVLAVKNEFYDNEDSEKEQLKNDLDSNHDDNLQSAVTDSSISLA